jgi:hypothetical protein
MIVQAQSQLRRVAESYAIAFAALVTAQTLVSERIRKRVQLLNVDDEATAALAQGLEAHANGHYRAVCRLLLPEIERVARVELKGNATIRASLAHPFGRAEPFR